MHACMYAYMYRVDVIQGKRKRGNIISPCSLFPKFTQRLKLKKMDFSAGMKFQTLSKMLPGDVCNAMHCNAEIVIKNQSHLV